MSKQETSFYTQSEYGSADDIVSFYINKHGFPLDDKTWKQMWVYATKIFPKSKDEIEEIKNVDFLYDVPVPAIPVLLPQMPISHCLTLVQNYINRLQYNHTGTQLFEIKKNRPLAGLMDKAKEMIKEALPIKCLEAVILSIYLTNGLLTVERFPIGFKSVFNGRCYYHVVLGMFYNGYFGALGISRRNDLMYKPLEFKTLFDLIDDYDTAYSRYTHQLVKVRLGGVIPHETHSQEKIHWSVYTVNFTKTHNAERQHKLDLYSRKLRSYFTSSFKRNTARLPIQLEKEQCMVTSPSTPQSDKKSPKVVSR
ncbi:unnamed protein product [Clavelina lepadiformis]|uniref:Vasohibin-like protein n=1 Tax=Clavelina lepadiformis TaxID=159417 RepID=A0ABP0GGZ4_CLALP